MTGKKEERIEEKILQQEKIMAAHGKAGLDRLDIIQRGIWSIEDDQKKLWAAITHLQSEKDRIIYEQSSLKESNDRQTKTLETLTTAIDELEGSYDMLVQKVDLLIENIEINKSIKLVLDDLCVKVDGMEKTQSNIVLTQEQNKEVIDKTRSYINLGKFIAENKVVISSAILGLVGFGASFGASFQVIIDKLIK